ncbi:MAG: hypothetical protein GY820_25615 [Gammaproteobacteria bacterium]|nr:hypothetical protein [Gammaproteobacteria bacterium]
MFDEVNYTINRNLRDIDFTPTYTATAGVIFINTTADYLKLNHSGEACT